MKIKFDLYLWLFYYVQYFHLQPYQTMAEVMLTIADNEAPMVSA
ncbi:hypothetical protein [Pseudolactococcus paracarnosus]|nr:hypothetical protein [Lactococcus paracarnosus]